jgi:hypothetical protein
MDVSTVFLRRFNGVLGARRFGDSLRRDAAATFQKRSAAIPGMAHEEAALRKIFPEILLRFVNFGAPGQDWLLY